MSRSRSSGDPDEPTVLGLRSAYDPAPYDESELWFMPGADSEGDAADAPSARARMLFDPAEWRAAQDAQSDALASVACAFGALDAQLRAGAEGPARRLALVEAEALSWQAGDRVGAERLALWAEMRLQGVQNDSLALARAGWAVRRLTRGPGPDAGGWRPGVTAFLGRPAAGTSVIATAGDESSVSELAAMLETLEALHPVCRAAALCSAWRQLRPGTAGEIEAGVMAARHGAAMAPRSGGAPFLPLACAGPATLRAAGPPALRLSAWLAGAEAAVQAALLELDRLADWCARAATAVAGLSGRTPPRLVAHFVERPVVTAPAAGTALGASRAAVQRNIAILQEKHLIREITGHGRFRVWTAKLR